MAPLKQRERFDADAARVAFAALGTALGAVWVVGLAVGATSWLAWFVALGGLACFGGVALTPERRPGLLAAGSVALVAMGLVACWVVALVVHATAWLAWCCFAFGLVSGLLALVAAQTAVLDHPAFMQLLTSLARSAVGDHRATPSRGR